VEKFPHSSDPDRREWCSPESGRPLPLRRIAVVIALTAGFAAPPAATAQFGPPEMNDPEVRADAWGMPGDQLVADATGRALWASAAFIGSGGKRQMAVYERCGAAATWPRVALLGELTTELWPQGIAVTPAGDALAVWRIADGASFSTFYSSARPAGGAWGAPQQIVAGNFGGIEFALSDAGEAVAAWTSTAGVQASIRPAGGAWGAPTTLTAQADRSAHVAMSAGGDAVVTSWDPPVWMRAFYRPAGGSWSGEETVEQTNYQLEPNSQKVEFDGQGRAVSVFSQNGFLHAAVRSGGAPWGSTTILDETAAIAVHTLARHPNGLIAVWNRKESLQSSNDQLGVARLGAGWEAKRLYDPPGRFMGATAAASSTGAILLAAAQEGGPSGDEDIVGVIVPSLVAAWPDELPRISPASTPTALYRNPVATGGGAALFLAWGVHGAPTDFSQAIATNAAPATCSPSQPQPQPVPPTPPQPAPGPLPPKPTPKAIGGFVVLPLAKACVERRRLKVVLRSRKGFPVRRIASAVKGERVALRKGAKVTGTLTLRRLPRGRYKVAVTVTLADGTVVRGERAYRAC